MVGLSIFHVVRRACKPLTNIPSSSSGKIVSDPVSLSNCLHCFCKLCLQIAMKLNPQCPTCKLPAQPRDVKRNHNLDQIASSFQKLILQVETWDAVAVNASSEACDMDLGVAESGVVSEAVVEVNHIDAAESRALRDKEEIMRLETRVAQEIALAEALEPPESMFADSDEDGDAMYSLESAGTLYTSHSGRIKQPLGLAIAEPPLDTTPKPGLDPSPSPPERPVSRTPHLPGLYWAPPSGQAGLDSIAHFQQLWKLASEVLGCGLGVEFDRFGTRAPTHLIVRSEERRCLRSIKYMAALLRGCWIVSDAWVGACLAKGTRVAEDAYEIIGDLSCMHVEGRPGLSRQAGGNARLFEPFKFFVRDCSSGTVTGPGEEVKAIVILGGGKWVTEREAAAASDPHYFIVLDDSLAGAECRAKPYNVVTSRILLDSVSACRFAPPGLAPMKE